MVFKKIAIFLSAFWFLFFLEMLNRHPQEWRLILFAPVGPLIFLAAAAVALKKRRLLSHSLVLPPFFLVSAAAFYYPFIDRVFLRHFFSTIVFLLLFLVFYHLILFVWQPQRYPLGALEQTNTGILVFVFFLFSSVFYGWLTFLAKNFWPALIFFAVMAFFVFWEMFSLRKMEAAKKPAPVLILAVLAAEFFWAISLWPIGFLTKGLILTLVSFYFYYLFQNRLAGHWDRKKIWINTVGWGLSAAIILLAAKWL